MSFRTAAQRFNAQAAAHRAAVFGGATVDGTADADGYNLQIGATKFNAPFSRLQTAIDVRQFGSKFRVTAKITLPPAHRALATESAVVVHLPSGERYAIVQVGIESSLTAEIPLLLRRLER